MTIPDTPGTLHLNALASVTTKGNALFVEVWDTAVSIMSIWLSKESNYFCKKSLKQVESAIHAANLPGISPQRMAGTTLKIPIAR